MRRSSKSHSDKLSADSQRLIALSTAAIQAHSRLEARVWERQLDDQVQKLLQASRQDALDAALDHLFRTELSAYDVLMETVEAVSESVTLEHEGMEYEALLIAVPILAWTRFAIASGPVPQDALSALSADFAMHILTPQARKVMAPALYSVDQLPHTYAETYTLTKKLAQAALKEAPYRLPATRPDTVPFLADVRYLLLAAVVPAGEPIFRWQVVHNPVESVYARLDCFEEWQRLAMPVLTRLMPGCNLEPIVPEAYYSACRNADKRIRPASIRAATHYLTHALGVPPADLRAVIGGFGNAIDSDSVEEYRVGFCTRQDQRILYGIVWPVYGQDEARLTLPPSHPERMRELPPLGAEKTEAPLKQLLATLQECGVPCETIHSERFPLEFCDDCGAPMYVDASGELVHAEMPDDTPQSGHFH
jgi:hypothetical protein